jgi:REP element-mobilizing transposase RayT
MGDTDTFHPFDPLKAVRVYHRDLPHWRQEGATYFVTFRQADSIPKGVLTQWEDERRAWLHAHGIDYEADDNAWRRELESLPDREQRAFTRMNARRLFRELDACHGSCLLRSQEASAVVADALLHFDRDRCRTGDFVVMPNHAHALLMPLPGHELEAILYSVKRFSSNRVNALHSREGRFWQKDNYDHIVRDLAELQRTREYIARNPAKAGLTTGEYHYYRSKWLDHVLETAQP